MVSFDSDGDDEDEGSCFSMFKVLRRDDDVVLVVVLLMKLFTLQVVVLLWQLTGHAFKKSWQDVLHLVRSEISACVTTCQYIKKQVPPHNTHSLIPIIRQYTCACDGCFPLKFPTFTPSLLPPLPSFTVVLKAPRNVGKSSNKTTNSKLNTFTLRTTSTKKSINGGCDFRFFQRLADPFTFCLHMYLSARA